MLLDPAILLIRIYLRESLTHVYQGMFARMFIAAEFLTAEQLEGTQMPTNRKMDNNLGFSVQ